MITKQIQMNVSLTNQVFALANTGESGSRFLEVSFVNSDNTPFDLSNKNVILYAEKPDKMVIFNNCTLVGNATDGKVLVEITQQMTAVAGVINCEFHIIENNSIILKVLGLKIIANQGVYNDLQIISSSEYTALLSALQRAENAFTTAQNLIDVYNSNILFTELGNWTPEFYQVQYSQRLPSFSYNLNFGIYYIIGKICHVSFILSADITSNSGAYLCVSGLPYVSLNNNDAAQYLPLGENWGNDPNPAGAARVVNYSNYLLFFTPNSSSFSIFARGTCKLGFSGSYIIDSTYC